MSHDKEAISWKQLENSADKSCAADVSGAIVPLIIKLRPLDCISHVLIALAHRQQMLVRMDQQLNILSIIEFPNAGSTEQKIII